jgi:hypothetical protein
MAKTRYMTDMIYNAPKIENIARINDSGFA